MRRTIESAAERNGWTRRYARDVLAKVKAIYKWAKNEELVSSAAYEQIRDVTIREGREKPPIAPVADEIVEATLPHLTPLVADMVRFQRLTGCRPGELVKMRHEDIDRTGSLVSSDMPWYLRAPHAFLVHGTVGALTLVFSGILLLLLPKLDRTRGDSLGSRLIVLAASFGLATMSLATGSNQVGMIYGGLLTITGMLGTYPSMAPGAPEFMRQAALAVPQGWAMRAWQAALEGGDLAQGLFAMLVSLLLAALFFAVGLRRFARRYA